MNEAQHGYKRNRSTDSASLIFINLVKSAEFSRDTSHRTSYDMSRAFDAVSKSLQAIAWRRLGVLDDVADWLVHMDVNGITVFRSPFSQVRWEEDAYMSVQSFSFPPSTTKCPWCIPKILSNLLCAIEARVKVALTVPLAGMRYLTLPSLHSLFTV